MSTSLYIGRFNPFHLGHIEALKYIKDTKHVNSFLIGIGSAQESFTLINPLTGGERYQLIKTIVKNYDFLANTDIDIIPLHDINNNNLWVSHVQSICPDFDVVFSNNRLVQLLFRKVNIKVESIPLISRNVYSGTKIREMIINNDTNWKGFVPKLIIPLLKEYNLEERLKILSTNDK
ncbi:MAG: nicotinamide-nucleotide adenylyltransferase [Candidatus Thorarchaeota archaeon]